MLILLGFLGGFLPDVIRLGAWASRAEAMPQRSRGVVVLRLLSFLIQSALGGLAVYLLGAASALQAVAIGYAGPEFLTRVLAAAVPRTPAGRGPAPLEADRGGPPPGALQTLIEWWRQ